MIEISSVPSAGPSITPTGGGPVISSDFQMFLKMLTTQMKNQDPLNPMESTEFATQLATFSGVEQQQRTNQLLEGMAGQGGMAGLAGLSGMIGMEVEVASQVHFAGQPLTLRATVPATAASATLVALSAEGAEVGRMHWDPKDTEVLWNGRFANGELLADGQYTLSLLVTDLQGEQSTHPVTSFARVAEVRQSAEGAGLLVLESGIEISVAEARALRRSAL